MDPIVITLNRVVTLKRDATELRRHLCHTAAQPLASVALAHLADLDESLRRLEILLMASARHLWDIGDQAETKEDT